MTDRAGGRLRWRDAKASDIHDIQAFTCTAPRPRGRTAFERNRPHPAPWELVVQTGIRCERPPLRHGTLLLGHDSIGLGAVSLWVPIGDPGDFKLCGVAVATRLKGRGHGLEATKESIAIMEIEAIDRGAPELYVMTLIHKSNQASQGMAKKAGFEVAEEEEAGYWRWELLRELYPVTE